MKDKKNARMAEKKSITQGASTYGTVSKSNSNDNSFEDDDACDPYAMRSSGIGRGSNNGSPSTKYGGDAHDEEKAGGPFVQVEIKREEETEREKCASKLRHRLDLAYFCLLHWHIGGYSDDGSERTGV